MFVLTDFIDMVINETSSFSRERRDDGGLWPSHKNSDAATIFLKSGKFNLLDPRTVAYVQLSLHLCNISTFKQ